MSVVLAFAAVFAEIPLSTPLIVSISIELCFHFMPREDDGTSFTVDILGWIARLLEMLDEVDGKVTEEGKVKAVEPDHWFLRSWVSELLLRTVVRLVYPQVKK